MPTGDLSKTEVGKLHERVARQHETIMQQGIELERARQLHDALLEVLRENDTERDKATAAARTHRKAMLAQQAIIRHLLFRITTLTALIDTLRGPR